MHRGDGERKVSCLLLRNREAQGSGSCEATTCGQQVCVSSYLSSEDAGPENRVFKRQLHRKT